jgi:excisionase family DNA binding protein
MPASKPKKQPSAQVDPQAAAMIEGAIPDKAFFTTNEIAQLIGVEPQTVEKWRCLKRGGPDFFKFGSAVRYSRAAVLLWLQSNLKRAS